MQATLEQVSETAEREQTLEGAHPHLRDDVLRFTRNLLEGRPAGGD